VNINLHLTCSTLNFNSGNARTEKLLFDILSKLNVFVKKGGISLLCEPAAIPSPGDPETETDWINFLTHFESFLFTAAPARQTRDWSSY